MHRKNGKIIYNLYKEGKIKDVMFYLKPKYVKNLQQIKESYIRQQIMKTMMLLSMLVTNIGLLIKKMIEGELDIFLHIAILTNYSVILN